MFLWCTANQRKSTKLKNVVLQVPMMISYNRYNQIWAKCYWMVYMYQKPFTNMNCAITSLKMNFIKTTFVIDFFFINTKTSNTLFTSSSWLMHYNIHGSWHLLVHLRYMYMQITCFQWREKFVIICRLNWKSRLNTTFMFAVINIGILQLKFTYVYLTSWHAFHDIWNGK